MCSQVSTLLELKKKLKSLKSDNSSNLEVAKTLILIIRAEYRHDPRDALLHSDELLALLNLIEDQMVIADGYNVRGIVYMSQSEYPKAFTNFKQSLEISEKIDDKLRTATASNNLGNVYRLEGNLKKAFALYVMAHAINESFDNQRGQINSNLNIGNILRLQKQYDEAMNRYRKALEISEELDDKKNIASCINNIGLLLSDQCKLDKAREQHEKALSIREEIGDTAGIANSYGNIGTILEKQKKYIEALSYYLETLNYKKKVSDRKGISLTYNNIASIYIKIKDLEKAKSFLERSLALAREIGSIDMESTALKNISKLYEARLEFEQALVFMKKHLQVKEMVFNEETRRGIVSLQVQYETERRERETEIHLLRNKELQKEVVDRINLEAELREQHYSLEKIIQERTAELLHTNSEMKKEIKEREKVEQRLRQSYIDLEKSFKGTVFTISKMIETRDPYTSGHQLRAAELANAISLEMGISDEKRQAIYLATVVHDIGKLNVPQEYLSKPGKLSSVEWAVVQTHPQAGYEILSTIDFPWPIAKIVLQHHELLDGSGYPQALKEKDILFEAKIVCVADVVEAMGSHRPYRSTLGIEKALKHISEQKGILYDVDVVNACIKVIKENLFDISSLTQDPYNTSHKAN